MLPGFASGLTLLAPQELPTEPADVLAVAQQIAAYAFAAKARPCAFALAGSACLCRAPLSPGR